MFRMLAAAQGTAKAVRVISGVRAVGCAGPRSLVRRSLATPPSAPPRSRPWGILILPPILALFYYGWTQRHDYVHEGSDERLSASTVRSPPHSTGACRCDLFAVFMFYTLSVTRSITHAQLLTTCFPLKSPPQSTPPTAARASPPPCTGLRCAL